MESGKTRLAVGIAAGLAGAAALVYLSRRARGLRVAKLVVYPVKGCKGLELASATLQPEGLAHDREFMMVQPTEGGGWSFVSQRQQPAMALIEPSLPDADGRLRMRAPGLAELVVRPPDAAAKRVGLEVWGDAAEGLDCGDEAAAWCQEFLKVPGVRLLKHVGMRKIDARFAEGTSRFSDGYPLLVVSEASLADMERRTGLGMAQQRFRPNLVLAGAQEAFAEDLVGGVTCGSGASAMTFRFVKPCSRCQVPSVDPMLGQKGRDPMRELKAYRSGRALKEKATAFAAHFEKHLGDTFFGQNAVPDLAPGREARLTVGDAATWL